MGVNHNFFAYDAFGGGLRSTRSASGATGGVEQVLGPKGVLGERAHVCGFFNGADEQYRVLLSFITEGLDGGDRAFHLIDPEQHDDHLRRLTDSEIDVQRAIDRGQLHVQPWEPSPPGGRRFAPATWLEVFERALEAGPAAGYPRTRFLGHMGWANRDAETGDDWFEFEARLNAVLAEHDGNAVVCAYDLTTVTAGVVIDALRTHPAVILGGLLQENPFYVPPEQFVHELQGRRARRQQACVGCR